MPNEQEIQNPLVEGFCWGLQTPYEGTTTDWIEDYVVMPHSSRSKRHRRSVFPQWTEIFDAAMRNSTKCLTVLAPPGGGKTGALECLLSNIVVEAPGPVGVASQTNETTEDWVKDRLLPTFEATEPVRNLLPVTAYDIKKDEISFPHMFMRFGGANLTNFQEKSLQYGIGDEVWRWDHGLIKELEARLHDRWNGKLWLFSQGGWSESEHEERWLQGTQHTFGFTCPSCKIWHSFEWSLFHYKKILTDDGKINWPATTGSVELRCTCGNSWKDEAKERRSICNLGTYKQMNDNPVNGWLSYRFSAFGVWQIPWATMVREWILANKAKEANDVTLLKTFVQKRMVQFADAEVIEVVDSGPLYQRREQYDPENLPNDIVVLTAGVDCQGDRLEIGIEGWGIGQENWMVDYRILLGNPTSPDVWKDLDELRMMRCKRQDGTMLEISCMCIDTGHHPNDVYSFVKPRQGQKVYAVKGSSEPNMPIVSRPKKSGVEKARLFMVGTDTAKNRIYSRLQLKPNDRGSTPGFIHFPDTEHFDETYFTQLVSEKVVSKIVRGRTIRVFQPNGRNEALDCKVYATAALQILNPNYERLAQRLESAKSEDQEHAIPEVNAPNEPPPQPRTVGGNRVWRPRPRGIIRRRTI